MEINVKLYSTYFLEKCLECFKFSSILNGMLIVIFSFHVIKTLRGTTKLGRGARVNRGCMDGPEAIYKFGFNHWRTNRLRNYFQCKSTAFQEHNMLIRQNKYWNSKYIWITCLPGWTVRLRTAGRYKLCVMISARHFPLKMGTLTCTMCTEGNPSNCVGEWLSDSPFHDSSDWRILGLKSATNYIILNTLLTMFVADVWFTGGWSYQMDLISVQAYRLCHNARGNPQRFHLRCSHVLSVTDWYRTSFTGVTWPHNSTLVYFT